MMHSLTVRFWIKRLQDHPLYAGTAEFSKSGIGPTRTEGSVQAIGGPSGLVDLPADSGGVGGEALKSRLRSLAAPANQVTALASVSCAHTAFSSV